MKKKTNKIPNSDTKKENVTIKKLEDLPFKTAKHLKEAQDQIRMQVWRRLEEAKVINEMLKLDTYSFWHDEFSNGLVCGYADEQDMSLVKVYSEGKGIKININRSLAATAPLGETVLNQLIKAMSESFATTYYRAKGLLPNQENLLKNESQS
ncbi:MAG: hypothetical protein EHM20_01370 [Alphaproteobacteria bacterium]|nr:MAG: hypothetical protein EHM20_01370 [Alphaproteobacteria bacterium]